MVSEEQELVVAWFVFGRSLQHLQIQIWTKIAWPFDSDCSSRVEWFCPRCCCRFVFERWVWLHTHSIFVPFGVSVSFSKTCQKSWWNSCELINAQTHREVRKWSTQQIPFFFCYNWSIPVIGLCPRMHSSDPLLLTRLSVSSGCSTLQLKSAVSLRLLSIKPNSRDQTRMWNCWISYFDTDMNSCPLFYPVKVLTFHFLNPGW